MVTTRTFMIPADKVAGQVNAFARQGFIPTAYCHVPTKEYNEGKSGGAFLVTVANTEGLAKLLATAIQVALESEPPSSEELPKVAAPGASPQGASAELAAPGASTPAPTHDPVAKATAPADQPAKDLGQGQVVEGNPA